MVEGDSFLRLLKHGQVTEGVDRPDGLEDLPAEGFDLSRQTRTGDVGEV